MHWLITTLLGGMCAWAMCRKNAESGHGHWVLRAGLLGGLLPHADVFFQFFSAIDGVIWPDRFGLLWTPLFVPFWVALATTILSFFIKESWLRLYSAMLIGWLLASLTAFLTVHGVEILPFIAPWKWGVGLINPFDYVIFALCAVILGLGIFLPFYRRDIARIGVLLLCVYIFGLGYVKYEAQDWAQKYARALELNVQDIYTLPQPLSPLNWRIMIVTADEHIHDSFVNLRRSEELEVSDTATRAWRIQALYKPKNRAVWRVYNRLNSGNLTKAQQQYVTSAWAHIRASEAARDFRFHVHTGFTLPPRNQKSYDICATFRDLRFEGVRKKEAPEHLVCSQKNTNIFTVFQ